MTTSQLPSVATTVEASLPGHVGVAEVIRGVGTALRRAFPTSLWVKGEVSDYRAPTQGHHYFNLVERLQDGSQVVLPCAVWKSGWPKIRQKLLAAGVTLSAGQAMLFQGTVRLYDGAGKLTFHVSDVYPEFTLGQIETQRRAVLDRLKRENLIGLNGRLEMSVVPLRIAVLSSRNAAGLHDFEKVLSNSGYAFSVLRCEVPVQGPLVEQAVCRALEILAIKQKELRLDAVCIVRGGGSATELGWWNSYGISAAIARMPVPVITGIGHDRDRVAADEVAHAAAPTPTAAAEILCSLVRTSDTDLQDATARVTLFANQRLTTTARAVKGMEEDVVRTASSYLAEEHVQFRSLRERCTAHARRTLTPHDDALRRCHELLEQDSRRALRQETTAVRDVGNALAVAAMQQTRKIEDGFAESAADVTTLSHRHLVAQAERHAKLTADVQTVSDRRISDCRKLMGHLEDMTQAYDPVHVLRRGFSITFDGQGKAVRSAADLPLGEMITTRFAAGQVVSTVTQTTEKDLL